VVVIICNGSLIYNYMCNQCLSKILKFWRTELSYAQNKNRGKKMLLLGMDTCPSLNDIMEIRCNKCTRSEQEVTYHCINFNDRFRKVPKNFHIVPFVDGSRYKINGPVTTTEFRMHCFNDRVKEVPTISPDIIFLSSFVLISH
jgi:hypothetical protein